MTHPESPYGQKMKQFQDLGACKEYTAGGVDGLWLATRALPMSSLSSLRKQDYSWV
jgi:hypothetical protein